MDEQRQSLQFIVKQANILQSITKFLGNMSDLASAAQLSKDFKVFKASGIVLLKENFLLKLAGNLPIKDTNESELNKKAAMLFCVFLSNFDHCFSGDAVLASLSGISLTSAGRNDSTIDVYIGERPDVFFVRFAEWAKSCKAHFKSGSIFEVGKMNRNMQWYPFGTDDYLRQDVGRWKNGTCQQIRFFFIRSALISPKTFALTCCDFTFIANWVVIDSKGAYSHEIGYVRHMAQKKGTYTRHFRQGWEEDRNVWRMLKNAPIAQKKAEDGARAQEIRRQVYDAVGFKLLGKRPRKLLDDKVWDFVKT